MSSEISKRTKDKKQLNVEKIKFNLITLICVAVLGILIGFILHTEDNYRYLTENKMIKSLSSKFRSIIIGVENGTNGVETTTVCKENITTIGKPRHHVDTPYEKATFGMGCFWSSDSLYGAREGVLRTKVGYSGGNTPNPVYRNLGDHTEVIEIHYDPIKVTYGEMLQMFWNNHEYGLTTRIKRQYMSLILYHSDEQKRIAEESRAKETKLRVPEKIITEIAPAKEFYAAEDYHQKYRLQGHKELARPLGLNSSLLLTSHIAARLNGYLVGVGGIEQFEKEADYLGLTHKQKEYVRKYIKENEGGGLSC